MFHERGSLDLRSNTNPDHLYLFTTDRGFYGNN
jgi:hypothetical protein